MPYALASGGQGMDSRGRGGGETGKGVIGSTGRWVDGLASCLSWSIAGKIFYGSFG